MPRLSRVAATAAVVASLAGISAAPASAQTGTCVDNPDVPGCVNYAFDVAGRTVEYVQYTYDTEVQPRVNVVACIVVKVVTTRDC